MPTDQPAEAPPGPISTQELAARVRIELDDVIVLREIPRPTPESVAQMFSYARHLLGGTRARALVADVSAANVPGAAVRAALRDQVRALGIRNMFLVSPTNPMMRVAARFVFASLGFTGVRVYASTEAALEDLRRG